MKLGKVPTSKSFIISGSAILIFISAALGLIYINFTSMIRQAYDRIFGHAYLVSEPGPLQEYFKQGFTENGIVYLGEKNDPADNSDTLYEVWEAKHSIKKGQEIHVSDFKIGIRKTFSRPPDAIRIWDTKVKWTAIKDFQTGQILLESYVKYKGQNKLPKAKHIEILDPSSITDEDDHIRKRNSFEPF